MSLPVSSIGPACVTSMLTSLELPQDDFNTVVILSNHAEAVERRGALMITLRNSNKNF